jgi:mRNA-degrading endonuclease toxin of MazEF toxin-antitoxin module
MKRGELWTVVPLDHPKPRPAIILSVDTWNAHTRDVIVVPLTTQPGPSRPEVHHADLRKPTYAKCGGMGTLPKSRLKQRIGRVEEKTLDLIGFELRRLLGLG